MLTLWKCAACAISVYQTTLKRLGVEANEYVACEKVTVKVLITCLHHSDVSAIWHCGILSIYYSTNYQSGLLKVPLINSGRCGAEYGSLLTIVLSF